MFFKSISNAKYCLIRHSAALEKCRKQKSDINFFIITLIVYSNVLKLKQFSSCNV